MGEPPLQGGAAGESPPGRRSCCAGASAWGGSTPLQWVALYRPAGGNCWGQGAGAANRVQTVSFAGT